MVIIIDERDIVTSGYKSTFSKEGVSTTGLGPEEFREWIRGAAQPDLVAVEAFLLGDCRQRETFPKMIRERSQAPLIAMNECQSLEQTLELFAAGVDDVVRKPVHVREILARIKAISRRMQLEVQTPLAGRIRVSSDGRDPEIDGEPLPLPRRERRILEYLMANKGRRVTKTQIFNFVYGLFD